MGDEIVADDDECTAGGLALSSLCVVHLFSSFGSGIA